MGLSDLLPHSLGFLFYDFYILINIAHLQNFHIVTSLYTNIVNSEEASVMLAKTKLNRPTTSIKCTCIHLLLMFVMSYYMISLFWGIVRSHTACSL